MTTQAQPTNTQVSNPEFLSLLQTVRRIQPVNVAQDFIDGHLYYGVLLQAKSYLINSDRNYIKLEEAENYHLKPNISSVQRSNFDADWIRQFHDQSLPDDVIELFKDITNYYRRYIILSEPEQYILLSLWTIGTYFFKAFTYYPYLHFMGEKGTGKSTLLNLIKSIAFNGQNSVGTTPAVLFRESETLSPCWLLDESEWLSSEHLQKTQALSDILKSGFNKGGIARRCSTNDNSKIDAYNVYSPKALASINELDNVLGERTIPITLQKKLQSERVEKYTESSELISLQRNLRNRLYIFGLQHGNIIGNRYQNNFATIDGIELAQNREQDIWAPMLAIANYIDSKMPQNSQPQITGYSKKLMMSYLEDRDFDDGVDNLVVKIVEALEDTYENCPGGIEIMPQLKRFPTSSVYQYLIRVHEFPSTIKIGMLTKKMKTLGFICKPESIDGASRRVYEIDFQRIQELRSRYLNRARDVNFTQGIRDESLVNLKTIDDLFGSQFILREVTHSITVNS